MWFFSERGAERSALLIDIYLAHLNSRGRQNVTLNAFPLFLAPLSQPPQDIDTIIPISQVSKLSLQKQFAPGHSSRYVTQGPAL